MTYCLGIAVDAGLVFASDSRTNAGVDHVNSYPKMFHFTVPDQAFFVLLTSGNLATTQAVVERIQRDLEDPDAKNSLAQASEMSDAARYVGHVSYKVRRYYQEGESGESHAFDSSFILGGQIAGKPHQLYMIYPQGNYIRNSPYAPFLQIGETKYGKPILDRIIEPRTSLEAAARCALVSIDSTTRSNLTVAPPIDLLIYARDALQPAQIQRYKLNSPYYASLRKHWGEGLKQLFDELPLFDWEKTSV